MAEEPVLGTTGLPHFLVRQIHTFATKAKRSVPPEEELVTAVAEIEEQTQIAGASFLTAHFADPEGKIATSGLIQMDEDGLLDEIEVEFPEASGSKWVLAAAEGTTEIAASNLSLTFEDKIVAELRKQWGHRTIPPGLTTRAQFVKSLVDQANLKGHLVPPIKFVCPGLSRAEPVAENTGSVQTAKEKALAESQGNKGPDTGKLTQGQFKFAATLATATGLDSRVVAAWCLAEESGGPAESREAEHLNNWLNIGFFDSGPGQLAFDAAFKTAEGGGKKTAEFLKGEWGGATAGIQAILKTVSESPAEQIAAIAGSGWARSGYEGGSVLRSLYGEIRPAEAPKATEGTGAKSESDVGQLSRGTPQNPDEDSWECMQRLAQEVDWFVFTDGKNTVYYMDGPDLIRQKPVVKVEFYGNRIERFRAGKWTPETGALYRPNSWRVDNTSVLYRATHKVKGKLQRKSRISKPQTPAEVRLMMRCEIGEYRAGQVVEFTASGPISENSGKWIIADATRLCMKDPYTTFLLAPPTEPLPEPTGTGETASGPSGTALAAFNASSTLSQMELPYLWGGGHQANGLANVKKGGPGLDCSGSTCWVLAQAGMFKGSSAEDSGELEKFGEPGEGKEMTVWANANHVFIEFMIPGHGRAQMNTNGPENGPRLYTLEQTMTFNPSPKSEGYVPRHTPST